MKGLGLALVVALLGAVATGWAAEPWPPPAVERLVEEMVEDGEHEGSVEQLLEELAGLWQRPIALRSMTAAQLRSLPLIAPGEAERIVQFLRDNPGVRAVEAVGIALGMPMARRQLFAMFYTLDNLAPRLDSTLRQRTHGDAVQRFGYRVPCFAAAPERMNKVYGNTAGTPLSLLLRATASVGDGVALGVKGVKRPGEPFFYSFSPQGFPYYSAYLQLQGRSYTAPRIVLGDFAAEFGTGQTVGSGLMLFRQRTPYAWGKQGGGVKGRLGVGDNSTLRGVAMQQQPLPWLSYSLALSAQPLTALLADGKASPKQQGSIATIVSSPTYTKQREADRHFNTWEFCAIANVQVSIGPVCIGYTAIATHYNRPFVPFDTASFRLPHPAQTHMRNGVSLHVYQNAWRMWGEVTVSSPLQGDSQRHAVSGNAGVVYSPSYSFSIGAQGYYYPYEASARYAQGVASAPQNRAGALLNAQVRIAEAATILVGGECVKYVNPRVVRMVPPVSWRAFAEAQYAWAQGSSVDARYRYRELQNVRGEKTYRNAAVARVHEARVRGELRQGEWLSLRTSVLYAFRDGVESVQGRHNWAVAQDVRLSFFNRRLVLSGRGAFYDCRGKGVMLALYEYAPLYSMAMSRFSKRGWRAYGMVDWRFYRGLSFTLKAAGTRLLKESLEELTELEQQRRNMLELTAQLRWKF